MLTAEKVKKAIDGGMSAVCAWCEHYWNAQDAGAVKGFCNKPDCGGPLLMRAFPKYQGPMSTHLTRICYICGGDAEAAVEIHDQGMIGVCKQKGRGTADPCIEILKQQLNRPGMRPAAVVEKTIPLFGEQH